MKARTGLSEAHLVSDWCSPCCSMRRAYWIQTLCIRSWFFFICACSG